MDGDLEDLIQGIFTQVVEYYKGCISNEVLHDAESNDWLSSNPYYENQKISTCIQFWAYTMQGIRADIFNVLNETLSTGNFFQHTGVSRADAYRILASL